MQCPKCKSKAIVKHNISQHKSGFYCSSCHHIFAMRFLRQRSTYCAGFFLSVLFLSPLILTLPMQSLLTLLSKENDPSADTLVILGRGPATLEERAYEAAFYWQQHPTVDIFVSGMTDAPEMIKILQQQGVPASNLRGERCSQTTWENGLFTEYLLNAEEANHVLLMTDPPHMARSVWVFEGFGFETVTPYPVGRELELSFSFTQAQRLLREYAALVAYGVSGKYNPEPLAQRQQSEAEAQRKLDDWNCALSGQQ
jgi:uncharacterized SAM-binding protein YcdF (DUF218 family)